MEMIDLSVTFSVLRKTEEVPLKEPVIGTDSTFTAEWARPLSDQCSADRSHSCGVALSWAYTEGRTLGFNLQETILHLCYQLYQPLSRKKKKPDTNNKEPKCLSFQV